MYRSEIIKKEKLDLERETGKAVDLCIVGRGLGSSLFYDCFMGDKNIVRSSKGNKIVGVDLIIDSALPEFKCILTARESLSHTPLT